MQTTTNFVRNVNYKVLGDRVDPRIKFEWNHYWSLLLWRGVSARGKLPVEANLQLSGSKIGCQILLLSIVTVEVALVRSIEIAHVVKSYMCEYIYTCMLSHKGHLSWCVSRNRHKVRPFSGQNKRLTFLKIGQGGTFPPTGESVSLQPPLVAQTLKVTKHAFSSSSQIRRRSPQVGAQVRHIWFDELRRDGWHVQSLIGCEPVAATEGVVVVSTFFASNPQHINRRDDSGVFRLLKVHIKSLLESIIEWMSLE